VTSPTGTDEHPEVAEISALTEGVLPPGRCADVRGHLDDCALCADVRASLEEIRGLLGTLPGTPRMPVDIAGRIDAAIAAEAVLASTAEGIAVSRETREPEHAEDVSRETAAAVATGPRGSRPAGHSPAATGPGRAARGRRRWRKGLLLAASTAAVLGLGGLVSSLQPDGSNGGSQASDSASSAGTDSLHARVAALLAESRPSAKVAPDKPGDSPANRPMFGTAAFAPSCVLDGIGRADQPLGAERYRYQGIASYLVVLAHPSNASRVDAYVVDASCASVSSDHPGKVLLEKTYPR
jgi:hypothetical protein